MVKNIISAALCLAATAGAVVSPANLDSDLTILIQNDLLGIRPSVFINAACQC